MTQKHKTTAQLWDEYQQLVDEETLLGRIAVLLADMSRIAHQRYRAAVAVTDKAYAAHQETVKRSA